VVANPSRGSKPVYTDENASRRFTDALRARGFDVLTAREAGTLGQDDASQLAFAASAGRVLVTFDRRDFRRTHAAFISSGRQHAGIVLLPQSENLARTVARASMLLDWLAVSAPDNAGESPLVNWNDLQSLLHRRERIQGYSEQDVRLALGLPAGRPTAIKAPQQISNVQTIGAGPWPDRELSATRQSS
jgi:hypothetical protein